MGEDLDGVPRMNAHGDRFLFLGRGSERLLAGRSGVLGTIREFFGQLLGVIDAQPASPAGLATLRRAVGSPDGPRCTKVLRVGVSGPVFWRFGSCISSMRNSGIE